MSALTVSLQALDQTWEELGRDRLTGVVPEGIQCTANGWGSDHASFKLRRRPGAVWPDLSAFTPVEIKLRGQPIWTGRVIETPAGADEVVSVECEGWQYHLDDDLLERGYIVGDIGKWVDARSVPGTPLGNGLYRAKPLVSIDGGNLLLNYQNDTHVTDDRVGAMLDLGPYTLPAKLYVAGTSSANNNGAPQLQVFVYSSQYRDASSLTAEYGPAALTTIGASFAFPIIITNPLARYLFIVLKWAAAGASPSAADGWVKFSRLDVYASSAYESGGLSTLKAPAIVSDVVTRICPLLSTDRSQVDPTGAATFTFPEFGPLALRSAREHIMAANTPHDWIAQVDVDKRPVFKPRPTVALLEAGAWSGAEFSDASLNSGQDIYERAIVEGSGPDSAPVRLERTQAQQAGAPGYPLTDPAHSNPGFEVNTTGWLASGSTITRDTGVFDSGVASGRWDESGASDNLVGAYLDTQAWTGSPWVKGRSYRLTLRIRPNVSTQQLTFIFGVIGEGDFSQLTPLLTGGAWNTVQLVWTPGYNQSVASVHLMLIPLNFTHGNWYRIDGLSLEEVKATLVARRRFRRSKAVSVSAGINDSVGATLGDTFLGGHKTAAFKGSLKVAPGGVRRTLGGGGVHPALLLRSTQQLIRLSDQINPDTGALGREGKIAAVTYDDDAGTADVAIDNERDRLEPVLTRYAILSGQAGS